jgi:hypothetical protein
MADFLMERLTFDKLFRMSEPKRVLRSATVRGPPLEIDSFQDSVYYCFNFKSNPSTTGLRHRGYVKFFKPKNAKQTPLQHVECLVDCTCPDYRYRWAWTNKQRGSGAVGPQSLNQAWNKAPRKTNPKGKSGLCKHVLAARQYIYGLLSSFPSDRPDTADKLNKLTKYAVKRWTDFPAQVAAAKERERELAKQIALRKVQGPRPEPTPEEPKLDPDARTAEPDDRKEQSRADFKTATPAPLPALPAKPAKPAAPKLPVGKKTKGAPPAAPVVPPAPAPSTEKPPAPYGGYKSKAEYDFRRRQGLGDSMNQEIKKSVNESVVNSNNGINMSNLNEALKLVREMEDDLVSGAPTGLDMGAETGADQFGAEEPLEPSEPPVSDSAIGADTEGETALGLLRQMTDLLQQITTAVAPPPEDGELGELEGEVDGAPVSGTVGSEMPPEPPSDEEESPFGGSDEKHEEHEDSETEEEEEKEEKSKNARPSK